MEFRAYSNGPQRQFDRRTGTELRDFRRDGIWICPAHGTCAEFVDHLHDCVVDVRA